MRVLLVDLERAWRGGQSQALLLLTGMRTRGHSVELLSVRGSALAERAKAQNISVHEVQGAPRRLRAAWLVRKLLRVRHFDIVHANEAHALTAAWLAGAHRRAPLVVARRVTFPISRGLSRRRYRAAARILAVSEAVRRQLLPAWIDPKRIVVVPDGVEVPELVSGQERKHARAIWNFAPDETVIAFVASLTAEKGHALLLDALAALGRVPSEPFPPMGATVPDVQRCRLLLAGEGRLRANLERRTKAVHLENRVIFAGFVEDIRSVYAACDLFVFPSLHEGGGTSLLTAMALAQPVIATASGGIKEIVENECNGLLVQESFPQDIPAAIARAISQLLADPELARKLGKAARETVAARFSADRMVTNTLAVIEGLARDSSRH